MKKIKVLIVIISILAMGSAFADRPVWTEKGKPMAEQKEAHKAAMNAKEKD
jgi:hypothetical protein